MTDEKKFIKNRAFYFSVEFIQEMKAFFCRFITFVFQKSSNMEISGRIIQIMPEVNGNGKNGQWRKQEFILETQATYPKKVCITVWGDNIDLFGVKVGDEVNASIDVESREYNGRWYTDVKAWKMEKAGAAPKNNPAMSSSNAIPDVSSFSDDNADDILPF